jgi:hypothetical protein
MKRQLVREQVGGEWYEYIPLGKFVVSAPAVCRGRPTFKYTRIEVAGVLNASGRGIRSTPSLPTHRDGSRVKRLRKRRC